MGIGNLSSAAELRYRSQILSIVNSGGYTTNSALRAALDQVMVARAADSAIVGPKPLTFAFGSETDIKSVFLSIAPNYDAEIVKWEIRNGISLPGATAPSLPYSPELLVLLSFSYNNAGKLLGPGLAAAIKTGNRAEAWFEIRYGSNKGLSTGVAKRRYIEHGSLHESLLSL